MFLLFIGIHILETGFCVDGFLGEMVVVLGERGWGKVYVGGN
jgi:hypothetical protein